MTPRDKLQYKRSSIVVIENKNIEIVRLRRINPKTSKSYVKYRSLKDIFYFRNLIHLAVAMEVWTMIKILFGIPLIYIDEKQ